MIVVGVLTKSRDASIAGTGKKSGENETECMGKQDPADLVAQFHACTGGICEREDRGHNFPSSTFTSNRSLLLLTQFTEKGFKKTENSEHSVVLLLLVFTLDHDRILP